MYLNPHEAMQLLKITTRQGLHKIVKNHNISFKSQGAGKPNLYLEDDLKRYMKDNAKNIKKTKTKTVIKKAEKIKTDIKKRKIENQELKEQVKKEIVKTCKEVIEEDFNIFDNEEDLKPKLDTKDFTMKDLLNEIGQDEFERVVALLKENGTYKEQDRALILTYAVSFQNWVYATIASGKQDNTTTDQFGVLKLHPYFTVAERCANQMAKNAGMLGIGVRSRIGIELKEKKKESIFDILNTKESFD